MMMRARTAGLAVTGLLLLSFVLLYREVLVKLVHDWLHDDNYSHGILIVPIALYFAWERRARLIAAPPKPSVLGLVLLFGSMLVLMAGTLGAELFLARVSMIGIVAGTVLFVLG